MDMNLTEFSVRNIPQLIMQTIHGDRHDLISIIDRDFRILWTTYSFYEKSPHQFLDTLGSHCYETYQGRNKPCRAGCPISQVFKTEAPFKAHRFYQDENGDQVPFEIRSYPVRKQDGTVAYALKYASFRPRNQKPDRQTIVEPLSRREREVLELIAEGYTNPEISKQLTISPHTVKSHVIHIFNKLGVNGRTQAAVLAARLRLI